MPPGEEYWISAMRIGVIVSMDTYHQSSSIHALKKRTKSFLDLWFHVWFRLLVPRGGWLNNISAGHHITLNTKIFPWRKDRRKAFQLTGSRRYFAIYKDELR